MFHQLNKKIRNGFTLIEIIASIAILGMVIAILLPVFPQIMSWSANADQELVASNLLGQVVADVHEDGNLATNAINSPVCSQGMLNLSNQLTYPLNGKTYTVHIETCKEEEVDLYRTHIQIFLDEKEMGETYTYIAAGGSQ